MVNNIWYVHPYAGGPGVGRYIRPYALARQWDELGARTTVFTAANHHQLDTPMLPGPLDVNGVNYEFLPCRDYRGNGVGRLINMADATVNLRRRGDDYAKRHGVPDAIISSSPHPYMFLATHSLAKHFGALSIFEVRDLWPLSFIELLGTNKRHPLVLFTSWLEKYAYRNASSVVSLLPLTKAYMVGRGLAPEKWHYVPNGVEAEPLPPSSPQAQTPECIAKANELKSRGHTVVGYTGGLGRPNNVESLVEALSICVNQHQQKLAAVIVGRGEMKTTIEKLILTSGLQDHVFVFEQVSKQTALDLLQAVDIGYISLKEGPLFRFGISPNKLFDYMLAGLPVLSCINAGNDPIQESGGGVSVTSVNVSYIAQALCQLAALGHEQRKAIGEKGREYVLKNHSYKTLASTYLDMLSSLQTTTAPRRQKS